MSLLLSDALYFPWELIAETGMVIPQAPGAKTHCISWHSYHRSPINNVFDQCTPGIAARAAKAGLSGLAAPASGSWYFVAV